MHYSKTSPHHKTNPDHTHHTKSILYCHVPGLLARAALLARGLEEENVPLAVAKGRVVRDASPLARRHGVERSESILRARRLCPALLVVPLAEVDARSLSSRLWDALADIAGVVEPQVPDAGFVKLHGGESLLPLAEAFSGLSAVFALGRSKTEARALAESGKERLEDVPIALLTTDAAVVGKLSRLGLNTFGAVASVGEEALRYQLGRKLGTSLYRLALGEDNDPVKSLWPLPFIERGRRFDLEPLEDSQAIQRHLVRLSGLVSGELAGMRRFSRKVSLEIETEDAGVMSSSWRPPLPVQSQDEVWRCVRRLLGECPPTSPVIGLRIILSELELPTATTLSLLDSVSSVHLGRLESTKRLLASRYGSSAITLLGKMPITLRDRRRQLVSEAGR
jgi:DNA polymerase IV